MKFKIFFSIVCLVFVSSIYNMDEKIRAESPEGLLFRGAIYGRIALVHDALDRGVNINTVDDLKATALMYAVEKKREDIVTVLLQANADPNLRNIMKNTSLMIAVIQKHDAMVKLLLEANADPYIEDCMGKTVLNIANDNNFNSIEIMLKKEVAKRRPLIRNKVIETTNLIPDVANIVAEYLYPQEKTN